MSDYKKIFTNVNYLYKHFLKAVSNSKWKEKTQRSEKHFLSIIFDLQNELEQETYELGPEERFITYERGKLRKIASIDPRDRTVMHLLSDNIYTPKIKEKIIYDNGASVPGRGITFSRKRFEAHLRKYYMKHGSNKGFILFGDFRKFYEHIDHDIAKEQLLELVGNDKFIKYLEDRIFDSFSDGVSIGNQHSQTIGIYYPHEIDNYVKIVRSQKYYGRYMDDWYIISDSKEELLDVLEGIRSICEKLKLELNENKTRIIPLDSKFTYLQIKYQLTETGRVIKRINPKRVTAMRRKLKKLKAKMLNGENITIDYIESTYKSWMGAYYKLLSREQRLNMISLYEELFDAKITIIKNKMVITYC